jgi:hypothetical protein
MPRGYRKSKPGSAAGYPHANAPGEIDPTCSCVCHHGGSRCDELLVEWFVTDDECLDRELDDSRDHQFSTRRNGFDHADHLRRV